MRSRSLGSRPVLLALSGVILASGGAAAIWGTWPKRAGRAEPQTPAVGVAPASDASIERFCSQHHALPPPEIFERRVWVKEIERMYPLAGYPPEGGPGVPPKDAVLAWYQARTKETLEPPFGQGALGPGPLRVRKKCFNPRGSPPTPAVANVRLARISDPRRLDLIFCDMRHGLVALQKLYLPGAPVSVLARDIPNPCHAEVVDLDRDGTADLLIANLGSFEPSDHHQGSIVWLRGAGGGRFEEVKLAEGLPRVADVQAADVDGDGDLDLAVAVFGWRTTGEVLYLENRTTDWSHPRFMPVTLDPRPGSIQTPIVDLDRDGKPDIVALLSQQFECIEVYLNRGREFRQETIWKAPHPAWGCTGIQLVDLDGDGDLDVLLANGDTLDHSQFVRCQGLRWLENRGSFPFTERLFEELPGCHRAEAVDLDGDGDLDIVACAFLPQFPLERARRPLRLESIIWLEQTSPGVFARHSIESLNCDYPTLDAGDFDGDGDIDVVLGNYALSPEKLWTVDFWITVVENLKVP